MANTFASLRDVLELQSETNIAALHLPGTLVSRRALVDQIDRWRESPSGRELLGGRVIVTEGDDHSAILAMARLDGWCDTLLLLPRDISHDALCGFKATLSATGVYHSDDSTEYSAATNNNLPATLLGPTRWVVPTSGTTGVPKLYAHSFEALTRHTKFDPSIGNGIIWGLIFDPFRFAGIQVVLQALCGGSTLAIADDSSRLSETLAHFTACGVNAISATPSYWRKILMTSEGTKLKLKQITLGGEIADSQILSALRQKFPEARIIHIYASTEAGVGFAVRDGEAGFPSSYVEAGLPTGAKLKVDENNQLLIKPSYNPPISLQACETSEADWVPTGDCVARRGDRYYFLGRLNGSINVGGNKVMPEEVETVIRTVAGVAEAKVQGRTNPLIGQIVEALVVAKSDADVDSLRTEILTECRLRLSPFKVPGMVKFVPDLKIMASGKIGRAD